MTKIVLKKMELNIAINETVRPLIKKIRDELGELVTDDFTDSGFLKWLQEYDNNLEEIIPNLRQYFRIIRSYDFTKFPKKYDHLNKYFPTGFVDVPGNRADQFVKVETMGSFDVKGIVKCVPMVHIVLHGMAHIEAELKIGRKREKETGHIQKSVFILDAEGAKMKPKWLSLVSGPFLRVSKILMKNYTAYTESYVVVNTPAFSDTIYNVFKPILSEKTKKKVVILGSNWKKDVLKYVDPEVLPVHYGGNFVDENNDPKCASKIVYTSKVPKDLYWVPSKDDPTEDQLITLSVGVKKSKLVTVHIEEKGSSLEWFYTADKDWGFGVFFTENENDEDTEKMEMVYPQFKHLGGPTFIFETDRILCKKTGFYKIWFNNSFAKVSKLYIKYKVNIIKP